MVVFPFGRARFPAPRGSLDWGRGRRGGAIAIISDSAGNESECTRPCARQALSRNDRSIVGVWVGHKSCKKHTSFWLFSNRL